MGVGSNFFEQLPVTGMKTFLDQWIIEIRTALGKKMGRGPLLFNNL